jgi:GST-like protein
MLEEAGLAYNVIPVNIGAGEQFAPDFLKISPNNRMPAIVDPDGPGGKPLSLFESGAILIYLADKTGVLRPKDDAVWYAHIQWLMWQMAGVGPMFGQANHFLSYAPEKLAYPLERYTNEARRLIRIADKRLAEAPWLGGDDYGIADIAVYPWMRIIGRFQPEPAETVHLQRWMDSMAARPAVQRGLDLLKDARQGPLDDKAKEILFGKTQFQKR